MVTRSPFLTPLRLQHVGELAHPLVQLAVGDLLVHRSGSSPSQMMATWSARVLQMPVDAVGGDVERAVLVPFDRDVVGCVGGVLDLGVGLDPVDALADLAPEPVAGPRPSACTSPGTFVVDEGPARPLGGNVIDLFGHRALPPRIACCVVPIYGHPAAMSNRRLVVGGCRAGKGNSRGATFPLVINRVGLKRSSRRRRRRSPCRS